MLVRPQATERRARTECALALNKIASDMMRAAANLTRAAAHLQNPDKSTARSLQMLRRYTHHHDELCGEEVEHVARALERGKSPGPGKKRKRRPNHNGSADVVALHPGGAPMTSAPIYERDLNPNEREIIDLFRRVAEGQQDSFMLAGKGLTDPHIAERVNRLFGPDSAPDDGPMAG